MTKFIQSALVAVAIVASASAAMAQTYDGTRAQRSEDPYAGHSPNSPQGNRAYWDYQGRHGN